MWQEIWKFIIDNNIIGITIFACVFFFAFRNYIKRFFIWFGKITHLKTSVVEFDINDKDAVKVDPDSVCPYKYPHKETLEALHEATKSVDLLAAEVFQQFSAIEKSLADMNINQRRHIFRDQFSTPEDRLYAGLICVSVHKLNGSLKQDVINFAKEHIELYHGIVIGHPSLKLFEIE